MEAVGREERISNLPDDLLVKILSSLETKHAFSTSILSKRWTNIWALVPCVSLTHDPDTCVSCLNSSESQCISFENFVDQVILVHRLPHILQFKLVYPDGLLKENVSKVNTWLSRLFNRKIRELSVDFTGNPWKYHLNLSLGVFDSDQLVSLTLLLEKIVLHLPNFVRFPKLKTCVISITNPNVNFTKKLCLGCPVLEELKLYVQMENCRDVANFDICSHTLQKLELRLRKLFCTDHNIVLDTPVLEYLVISDDSLANYNMKNLGSLAEARIHVHDCSEDFSDHIHGERLRELLRGISKVRSLRLPLLSLNELIRVDDDDGTCSLGATTFMNVTSLELGVYCIPRMLIVLARMPNLAHLKLSSFLGQPLYGIPVIQWHDAPGYLPPRLKVIEVALEDFGEEDLQLLMYFLENAMLLGKMIIEICIPTSTDEEFAYNEIIRRQERLLMCPCASETCSSNGELIGVIVDPHHRRVSRASAMREMEPYACAEWNLEDCGV